MSKISITDLDVMVRLHLIPPEIIDSWCTKKNLKTPLVSVPKVVQARKIRAMFRRIIGPALFFALGTFLMAFLYEEAGGDLNLRFNTGIAVVSLTVVFFFAGCVPHPLEEAWEPSADFFGEDYGLLQKRTGKSFLELRSMTPLERTQLTTDRLVSFAEEVLNCEEFEKELSRSTGSNPDLITRSSSDVESARTTFHKFHKVAQILGVVPSGKADPYFDLAKKARKIKDAKEAESETTTRPVEAV